MVKQWRNGLNRLVSEKKMVNGYGYRVDIVSQK